MDHEKMVKPQNSNVLLDTDGPNENIEQWVMSKDDGSLQE